MRETRLGRRRGPRSCDFRSSEVYGAPELRRVRLGLILCALAEGFDTVASVGDRPGPQLAAAHGAGGFDDASQPHARTLQHDTRRGVEIAAPKLAIDAGGK